MSTLISEKRVKTRKPHRCFGCAKEYPKGSWMCRFSVADCGTVWASYKCEVCEEYEVRFLSDGDFYGYGDFYDNDPEGWEEVRQEILKEKEKKSDEE